MTNRNSGKGKLAQWLRDHANFDGEECLIWPGYIDPIRGYGTLGYEGKMTKAHIFMCELVNGPRPNPDDEATHSCGKGRQGCVHPKHLSWDTRSKNQLDRAEHGTAGCGRVKRTKLTANQVEEIRGSVDTNTSLAAKFGVDRSTIRQIKIGKIWNHKAGRQYSNLEPEQIKQIRGMIGKRPPREIAAAFGIKPDVIHRIRSGTAYRNFS